MDVFSWTSLHASGNTCDVTFYIWGVFTVMLADSLAGRTMAMFWRIISWSFYWLWMGRWPTRDWNDSPYLPGTKEHHLAHVVKRLADGYYGVLWVVTAGLGLYYHGFKLENGPTPCIFGRCDWNDLN